MIASDRLNENLDFSIICTITQTNKINSVILKIEWTEAAGEFSDIFIRFSSRVLRSKSIETVSFLIRCRSYLFNSDAARVKFTKRTYCAMEVETKKLRIFFLSIPLIRRRQQPYRTVEIGHSKKKKKR